MHQAPYDVFLSTDNSAIGTNSCQIAFFPLSLQLFGYQVKIFYLLTFCLAQNRSSHQRCSMKNGVLRNFTKFTGKHMCQSLFFNTVAYLSPATLLKKRLWHRYFPVNFAKFLRTPFLKNTSGRLLRSKRFVPSEEFYKKGVLKKIQQFTGKRLFQNLSLNNVARLIKKQTLA